MDFVKRLLRRDTSHNDTEVLEEPLVVGPVHWIFVLLRCSDGALYADVTQDARQFVKECNEGVRKIAYLSAGRLPVFLAFSEEFMSEQDAKDRMFAVQAMTREKKERLVSAVGIERVTL